MSYILVDLEATCWEGGDINASEIIEIGAVRLLTADGPIADEFGTFIRPVANPTLSAFCTELTTIRQEDVDAAPYFWEAFPRFLEWIGDDPFTLCSWGQYDLNQFRRDCKRHKIPLPETFGMHINLKAEFARLQNTRPQGMMGALEMLKIKPEGQHHRGIDDVRNIAKIAVHILPRLEAERESNGSGAI